MRGKGRGVIGWVVLSILLQACASGYRPVDNREPDKGRPFRWLKGKSDSISILLEAHKDRVTDNFAVTLLLSKVVQADSPALSDVRVTMTENGEPPDRYVLQRIDFYRYPPSGSRALLEAITADRVKELQHFDLSKGGTYVLHYFFSKGPMSRYPKEVTIHLDAMLSKKGTPEPFQDSILFRRHSQFDPFH